MAKEVYAPKIDKSFHNIKQFNNENKNITNKIAPLKIINKSFIKNNKKRCKTNDKDQCNNYIEDKYDIKEMNSYNKKDKLNNSNSVVDYKSNKNKIVRNCASVSQLRDLLKEKNDISMFNLNTS